MQPESAVQPTEETPASQPTSRRARLGEAATKLLPLVKLLDAIQPQVGAESVFRTRRKKIRAHWDEVYAELRQERPSRQALAHAFQALTELVRDEVHDVSKDEVKQAAKELALATLKNAPALLNAARQARLLD
ncbi:hypothetical protein Q5H93_11135 [Hymenobacter sp. ASUV-10]|uniref:Uncharacterized protein n=1 Tax=Hymenobacter aranciens TaxID=3063996 RepID=A0ABT9BCC0_9BACT|nr:hypothetical protein [Hymenobacter sp. ASUV-10]MDO7875288.1 hypothetical protein [Hymenobacter sp. ASUV-10]